MFIKNIRYSTWVTGDRIVVISVLNGSTCFFSASFCWRVHYLFLPMLFCFSYINHIIVKEIRIVLLFTEMR